jgi:hypothetical protein
MDHLDLIKKEVIISSYELRQNLQNTNYAEIYSIQSEEILVKGEKHSIRRLYVNTVDSNLYHNVGWVLNNDIENCMVCGTYLSTLSKHHCKSCGNILCEICSSSTAIISGLESCGELRVCDMCFWGQVSYTITYIHILIIIAELV